MRMTGCLAAACVFAFAFFSACGESAPEPQSAARTTGSPPAETATTTPDFAAEGRLTFSAISIWQVDADGSDLAQFARPLVSGSLTSPTLSPEGDRIAYITAELEVVVAPLDDAANPTARVDLVTDESVPGAASDPSIGPSAVHWSPDGQWLLVTRQRIGGSGRADVMLVRPDGSDAHTIVDALRLPSFPEATWSEDRSPGGGPPSLVVVGGADGLTGVAYDTEGRETGAALPFTAMRHAVATHGNPAGEGALITSALGSPEPFGPIEVIDITGATRIIGGGCGAAWSPAGDAVAYYDGYGIVVQALDAPPDERVQIVSNADLLIDAPQALHKELCDSVAIVWRADAPDASAASPPRMFRGLGATFEYPAGWVTGATAMPYASCRPCSVLGPASVTHPYGIQLWKGEHQAGCQLTCYLNIRALAQEATHEVDANGRVALRQEFERQRPLGLVNTDGDNTSYREILTVVPLAPIDGLPPEAFVPALFIDAYYRYGDAAAESAVRAALTQLLATLALQ